MPDMCFGLHLHSRTPAGHILVEPGPIMSAADTFKLTIHGKGGHGAEPQDTVDPILTAVQIINSLQTIVSRNVNPLDVAVVGIGSIHAGDAANVIPDVCELTGTIRTYLPATRQLVHRRIGEITRGVAEMNGATAELKLIDGVPATVNDPQITRELIPLLEKMLGADRVEGNQRSTPSEDMSIFLQEVPGTYFVLGAGGLEYPPHHSPQFYWDDSVLPLGAGIMAGIVSHFSQKEIQLPG
jgi:amidohydrolase